MSFSSLGFEQTSIPDLVSKLTSLFTATMTTTATRGCCLKRNELQSCSCVIFALLVSKFEFLLISYQLNIENKVCGDHTLKTYTCFVLHTT